MPKVHMEIVHALKVTMNARRKEQNAAAYIKRICKLKLSDEVPQVLFFYMICLSLAVHTKRRKDK